MCLEKKKTKLSRVQHVMGNKEEIFAADLKKCVTFPCCLTAKNDFLGASARGIRHMGH
jgi:hypothetical protein